MREFTRDPQSFFGIRNDGSREFVDASGVPGIVEMIADQWKRGENNTIRTGIDGVLALGHAFRWTEEMGIHPDEVCNAIRIGARLTMFDGYESVSILNQRMIITDDGFIPVDEEVHKSLQAIPPSEDPS